MNPINTGYSSQFPGMVRKAESTATALDVEAFESEVAKANYRLTKLSFLNLQPHFFPFEVGAYSDLERSIITGNKAEFIKNYHPAFLQKAFACAFFFNKTDFLIALLESGTKEQQFFMLECFLAVKEIDVKGLLQRVVDRACKHRPFEAALIHQQFQPLFDKIAHLENFDRADEEMQEELLCEAADDTVTFCILWNRTSTTVRNHKDENERSWIHYVIKKRNPALIQHLLNTGAEIKCWDRNRVTPLKMARQKLIEPQYQAILNELERRDEGFTDKIDCMMVLGHRIKIFAEPLVPSIEGIGKKDSFLLDNSLIRSLRVFSSISMSERFSDERMDSIVASLLTVRGKDAAILLDMAKKNWQVVQGGWNGHFVSYLFYVPDDPEDENSSNYCIKINTGSNVFAGLTFYQIGKLNRGQLQYAVQTVINHSLQNVSRKEAEAHFESGLIQTLQLRKITKIKFIQDEKNCHWAALKASFLGLLIVREIKEKNALTKVSIKSAYCDVKDDYETWEEWDLIQSTFQLNELLIQQSQFFDRIKTFSYMFQKCLNMNLESPLLAILNLVPQFADAKNNEGKTIIRMAYEKKMANVFAFLIKSGARIDVIDDNGECLADDIADDPALAQEIVQNSSQYGLTPAQVSPFLSFINN